MPRVTKCRADSHSRHERLCSAAMASNKLPTITGYSSALFATWYFCDEMSVLFDCGDGVCSGLLQKARKIKHVFISHADRDHLAGLLQFNQLNARERLKIYYPESCGSFPALADFSAKFDPQSTGTQWIPIKDGQQVYLRDDLAVTAFENRHVPREEGETKSLSYRVDAISTKLKPEFAGKSGAEIGALRKEHGADFVSALTRTTKLIYSGDTPIEKDGRYDDAEILIHEATFLTSAEIDPDNPRRNKHSSLEQVIAMVARTNIQHLILGHFSSRYDHREIDKAIERQCVFHDIKCAVYRVLPGEIGRDILRTKQCWPLG